MKSKKLIIGAMGLLTVIFSVTAFAGVPQLISYQGYLTDNFGDPLDGTYNMKFSVYDDPNAGSLKWTESKPVTVTNGQFHIYLGDSTSIDDDVFSETNRYLGITVESDPEMPRSLMATSPYAYRIATVDGSTSKLLVLDDPASTRVELGVGSNVLKVYDENNWLRVRISVDSTGARGLDGGGAISFFPAGAFKRGEEDKLYEGAALSDGLIRLGESEQGAGEINIYDTAGNELARMTSTAGSGGAYYTYWDDGTRLSVQGQSTDSGGYIGTFGTAGNRSATLSSLVGKPGFGFLSTSDSTGTSRTHLFTDAGADGHFFMRNHFGTTTIEMSNYGNEVTSEGSFVHAYGPNGKLNCALWFLGGYPNNGYLEVFDSLGQSQAGMYVETDGQGIIYADVKNFKVDNPLEPGTEIWYASMEGPEAGTYYRGTAKLVNGRAIVNFPDHFTVVASSEGMTVQVVPLSADSRGLAVTEKTTDRIVVQELNNGTGTYEFDFTISAVRKGFEDYQVVRPKASKPDFSKSAKMQKPEQAQLKPVGSIVP